LAVGISWAVVRATADTALPVIMTPAMTLIVLLLTILMSVLSAVLAIVKVMRIDPVMVFTR
jgi:putative ABC transport system permease protein